MQDLVSPGARRRRRLLVGLAAAWLLMGSTPPELGYAQLDAADPPFACGLLRNGEIACWGDGASGRTTPPAGSFRSFTLGDDFGCALRADDTFACWGASAWIGVPPPSSAYLSLAAGASHVCAVRPDLQLECWGSDNASELSPPAGAFREVESGEWASCALDLAGAPTCWGQNAGGSLHAPANERFVHLAMGRTHVCGLRADGSVHCWGSTESGETGVPPDTYTALSGGSDFSCGVRANGQGRCWGGLVIETSAGAPFVGVAAGGSFACFLGADGKASCVGANESGQATPSAVALPVVSMGENHACTTNAALRVRCWGDDSFGQRTPPSTSDVVSVGAGNQHTCAIEQDGDAVCFGLNGDGQATSQPAAGDPFVQVDGGAGHTCGVRVSGAVTCWGANFAGQGTPDAGTYAQVSAGGINNANAHTCGITTAGALLCWGTNTVGQAADQSGTWRAVSAGQAFTCGVRTDGTLGCFGQNIFGQATPPATGVYTQVAAARFHACALEANGTVRCWGDASDGKTTPRPGKYVSIAAVGDTSCGVLENGAVACWGADYSGQAEPSFDADGDGLEDAGDACPNAWDPAQLDGDADGVGSSCDVCPSLADPDQVDRDGDGRGDACDNCVDVSNPSQSDANGDGRGDACEPAAVTVRRSGTVPPPGPPGLMPPPAPGDAVYELYVACGSTAIQRVELGVVLPQGTTPEQVSFGPGCTSTSCSTATGLGPTVNAALSRALGPGLETPGTRADTVYFSLVGSGTPDNRLCSPLQENLVARFNLTNNVVGAPAPNLTTEGTAPLGLKPLSDPTGTPLPPEEYSFVAIDSTPTLALTLAPAAGDTTGRRWQIELDTNLELAKASFGLVAPAGTTTAQMRFTGCTALSGTPATRRACAANDALGPYVAPAASFSIGPGASASGLRTDTLYVSVSGARASGLALPALNIPPQPVVLGVVELDTTTVQPALTLDGVSTTSVFGAPYLQTNGSAVATQAVQIGGGYNAPSDFDADGRSDDLDNCPFAANTNQANAGGFLSSAPDAYGDACQCGEGEGNGTVFPSDAAAIRAALAGGQPATPVAGRCSVAGGPECDVRDVVVLRRALSGLSPGITSVCSSAVRSTQR